MFWEVKIGIGLGGLRFGASREQVEAYLGVPEQISEDMMAGDITFAWYYWDKGITAHFEGRNDYRLGMLQVSNSEAMVSGKKFIGMPQKELLKLLATTDLGKFDIDADPDWPSVTAEDLGLTFVLKKNKVESLQISTLMDENEEDIWPD